MEILTEFLRVLQSGGNPLEAQPDIVAQIVGEYIGGDKIRKYLYGGLNDPQKERLKEFEETDNATLTDIEWTLLVDMAKNPRITRDQETISTYTDIKQRTLKTLLKRFEERGWISRPHGPRSGYLITEKGVRVHNSIKSM
ncbi:MAG: hypothetical protein ACYS74_08135 [Planctomycetota bacterium]